MEQYRDPDSGADVRRAGRKVSVSGTECEIHLFLNHIVNSVYLLRTLGYLAAGFQDLDSQVVFFVNHRSEEFPLGYYDASRPFAECVVPAYKMPFYEKMFVQGRCIIHADIEDFIAKVERHHNISELIKYRGFFFIRAAAKEFVAGKIPGQTNPRGYYYIGQRPGAVEPFIYIIAYVGQFHLYIAFYL